MALPLDMRNKILTELFTSKEFNGCISKMQPVNLQEDLKAEVGLILCELPERRLEELHTSGQLKFFTVRIVLNLIKSFNSPFYKKFRKVQTVELSNIEVAENSDIEIKVIRELALNHIDNLYWYDKEMLMLYLKHGNYRAIEAETGIPWESAYKSIQKACKEIRLKIDRV